MHSVPVLYSAVRHEIPHGAILLWRRSWKPWNRAIAGGDRSVWSHVGRVDQRPDGVAVSLEFLQFRGPIYRSLDSYVVDYPGRLDVFAPNLDRFPEYDPNETVQAMRGLMFDFSGRYGWRNIGRVARAYLPGWRLRDWSTDDAANGDWPPHCSDAASRCDQAAGVDPVPNTPSYNTTPGDFGRSLLYQYRFTLYWTPEQVRLAEAA